MERMKGLLFQSRAWSSNEGTREEHEEGGEDGEEDEEKEQENGQEDHSSSSTSNKTVPNQAKKPKDRYQQLAMVPLTATLRKDGRVETSAACPRRSSLTRSNAFFTYRLTFQLDPFKRAVYLLAIISVVLLVVVASLFIHHPPSLTKYASEQDQIRPPITSSNTQLYSNYYQSLLYAFSTICLLGQLLLSAFVISKFPSLDTDNHGNKPTNFIGNHKLESVQLALLILSAMAAASLANLDWQLLLIHSITMFTSYTLLGVSNREAFLVNILGNSIQLTMFVVKLFLSSPSSRPAIYEGYSYLYYSIKSVIFLIISFAFFHIIGLYLNQRTRDECRSSFNDIKNHVSARIMMDTEDKRLTRLLESVIPKHLVGRMREDILAPRQTRIFRKLYLDSYDNVSILFADIVNFTKISSNCSAQLLVETLNELFGRFDKAADKNHCLRIKILGDCYYCVSGIPDMSSEHAIRSVEMGLDMIDILGELAQDNSVVDLNMRVGIHSGRALCGVLGKKRWQYDVHSNDVKLANHMEQSGVPGRVHITEDTLRALDNRFEVEPAKGHLRDTYIAQRNILTYFVLPPARRRRGDSVGQIETDQAAELRRKSLADSIASTSASIANVGYSSLGSDSGGSQLAASSNSNVVDLQLQTTRRQSSSAGVVSQQQAKLRFKLATQRIINALHFIRTIDAPFANLQEAPASDSPNFIITGENIDRMLNDTILSRCQEQNNRIQKLTLKFKDRNLSNLYGKQVRRVKVLIIRLLLFISSLVCLTLLAHELWPNPITIPPKEIRNDNGSSMTLPDSELTETERDQVWNSSDLYSSRDHFATSSATFPIILTLLIALFLLTIFVYCYQSEFNDRRSFLWRQAAIQDKHRVAVIRDCNKFIFFNLLPPHVASYFLQDRQSKQSQQRSQSELYYKSYDRIGVVFASVSNFSEFYSEVQGNNHGLGCLLLLNEIICDFDSILEDERFKSLDKIKTIGSTYMAAIGLFPQHQLPSGPIDIAEDCSTKSSQHDVTSGQVENHDASQVATPFSQLDEANQKIWETRKSVAQYLHTLISFVLEMRSRLNDINKHSYNHFKLRVGINYGPVTAGVIGASKPQYDIWGNTVNVASRMETNAEAGKIQITEEVYQVLKDFNEELNYNFVCRGSISVKGKGMMTTYYLDQS